MKYRPMLFSTPMVIANLEGRKTQTRRTKGLDYINKITAENKIDFVQCMEASHVEYTPSPKPGFAAFFGSQELDEWYQPIYCPYGNPGDVLWVRETWHYQDYAGWHGEFVYKASSPDVKLTNEGVWRPSIHMPKKAARIFLRVTDIRVERLQDICEADAVAEGLSCLSKDGGRTYKYGIPDKDRWPGGCDIGWRWTDWDVDPRGAYFRLWRSINGPGSVAANPWVWVVSYERIEKPEGWPI